MKNKQPGDRVTIYADPLHKTKPEGRATVVKHLGWYENTEQVEVCFDGDDASDTFTRIIYHEEVY